jgi:uncharacterized protein with von Willebrand factor type A (vWA) domain
MGKERYEEFIYLSPNKMTKWHYNSHSGMNYQAILFCLIIQTLARTANHL